MKVIITKDTRNLGLKGEIRQVKDGYARNYLIPRGLARPATEGAIKNWKLGEENRKKRLEKELTLTRETAKKMGKLTLPFARKVSGEDSIFGSVSKADIVKSLKSAGFLISKENIELDEPIKKLGETSVVVVLKPDITCKIKIKIAVKK